MRWRSCLMLIVASALVAAGTAGCSTCQQDGDGCWVWGIASPRATTCTDATSCAECADECGAEGVVCEADTGTLSTCTVGGDGCLDLTTETCSNGCKAEACVAVGGDPETSERPVLVDIPAGTFTMGSATDELGRDTDETQHQVTLTRSYKMMATEVTQGQWETLMGNNPSYFSATGDGADCGADCPVETVSWYDSLAYANALSTSEGLSTCCDLSGCTGTPGAVHYTCPNDLSFSLDCAGYRLPTESEWEYAYRSGTSTAFYNGEITNRHHDPLMDEIGWYYYNSDTGSLTMPHAAAGKLANAWGLYDMAGNVYEWTWDWYVATYPGDVVDPLGAALGSSRVGRGGVWANDARDCRAAERISSSPGDRSLALGFRLARSIP